MAEYTEKHVSRADDIYMALVKQAGLFGKAFFGHKATKQERRKLNRFWEMAKKQAAEESGESSEG